MSTLVYAQTTVRVETCWNCGLAFGMAETWARQRETDGATFLCPAGCKLRYGPSKIEQLEKRAADEKALLQRRLDQARAERDRANEEAAHAEARARGYKGAMVQARKRSAKGVCPAPGCKRSFVDVAKHVATKHPELVDQSEGHAHG